jgi:putative transposase
MISFKGRYFPKDLILMAVRWEVAYPLSYRQIYCSQLDLRLGAVDASTRSVHAVHEDGETSTATTPQIQLRAV